MRSGETARAGRRGRSAVLKVLGVAVLMALVVVALKLAFRGPAPGSVTGDPLAIRLVAVCPDGGDAVYDAAGRKVGEEIGTAYGPDRWPPDQQCREFIFELPPTDRPITFSPFPLAVSPATAGAPLGTGSRRLQAERDGQRRLYLGATFATSYRRRMLRFFSLEADVDAVDLTLRYYVGGRGPAEVTFTGPFEPGVATQADDGLAYTLTPLKDQPEWVRARGAQLHLSTLLPFYGTESILAYDSSGARHIAQSQSGSTGSSGAELDLLFPELGLRRIAAVTFGEKPRERTFHNIRVSYPDLPRHTHAAYLDEVAKRLGRPPIVSDPQGGTTWGSFMELRGPADALKVIDVARGYLIVAVGRELDSSRFHPDELDEETRELVHRTALGWLDAYDPRIRTAGIQVGLKCGWHEFVEPALTLVRDGDDRTRREAAYALRRYSAVLQAIDFRSIADLLLTKADGAVAYSLVTCLRAHVLAPAAAEELLRLAGSDRAWLWWPAIERLCSHRVPARERLLNQALASDALHARIIMVAGAGRLPGESLPTIQAANDGMPGLLSPALFRTDGGLFSELLRRMDAHADHGAAAAGVVAFLQRFLEEWDLSYEPGRSVSNWWAVDLCVKYLNRWLGQDIAGLGTDVNHESGEDRFADWREVAGEAIARYRDAAPSLASEKEPENPARVVLPNGVIVELAAVGDYPSKGARWWRPDGTPLAGPPDVGYQVWPRTDESTEDLPAGRPYQMVLKLTNWGPQATHDYMIVTPGTMVVRRGVNGQDFLVAVGVVPEGVATCTASIGLYPGPGATAVGPDATYALRAGRSTCRVVFENVSLEPGHATQVEVGGEGIEP